MDLPTHPPSLSLILILIQQGIPQPSSALLLPRVLSINAAIDWCRVYTNQCGH